MTPFIYLFIYLIDDDPVFYILTERVILNHLDGNVEVKKFTNPEEAVEAILNTSKFPDYIFLDILMPALDGWELLTILHEEIPNLETKTKVIMLTTSILPTDQELAEKDPAVTHFINKPLDVVNVRFVFEKIKPDLLDNPN